MHLKEKFDRLMELDEYARKLGCTQTCLLLAREINIDERIRMKCFTNSCQQYNKNLMCPPLLPSLEEIRRVLDKYTFALLIMFQHSCSIENWKNEFDKAGIWMNETVLKLEKKAFSLGFYMSLGLGSGECKLCDVCAAKEGSRFCNRPGEARPSVEGMGIDVSRLCREADLPMDFVPGELSAVGLLLID